MSGQQTPSPKGTGFAVVAQHRALGFSAVTNPTLARGIRFERVWIFGTPTMNHEVDLWRAIAPIVAMMPTETVIRIESTPHSEPPVWTSLYQQEPSKK